MEAIYIWFFVILFRADAGHWQLDPTNPPLVMESYQACVNEGMSRMVDRRNPNINMLCVEADDEADLVKILLENIDFGQKKGDPV